jgi:CRISPR system Cascade subunit CasD
MPDFRWLVLRLEAPLVAFGGVSIDHIGVTRDFPSQSMLTGLFANALGWTRVEAEKHQALQERIIFAARCERENLSGILTDTQNAKLEKSDEGFTTHGAPEGRTGASYDGPHRRHRDYHMDCCVSVVLRLKEADEAPDLAALSTALDRPARPLFIGRKPCLPAFPLRGAGFVLAPTAYAALQRLPSNGVLRALWPLNEGPAEGREVHRIINLPDIRNWRSGLHGGSRMVVEGAVVPHGRSV